MRRWRVFSAGENGGNGHTRGGGKGAGWLVFFFIVYLRNFLSSLVLFLYVFFSRDIRC